MNNTHKVSAKDPETPSRAVDPVVIKHKKRVNRVMAQREIDSINNDNWMEL